MQAPIQFVQVEGLPPRPRRILRREWKRNKHHLPKSTSLPILQLTPTDRPMFTCHQCGFVNTLIPLCLWCCWTSDMAHREFELSMPRVRRASAPPRVLWVNTVATSSKHTSSLHAVHGRISLGARAAPRLDIPGGKFRHSERNNDGQVLSNAEVGQRGRTPSNLDRGTPHKRHHRALHDTFFKAVHGVQNRVIKTTSSNSLSPRSQPDERWSHTQTIGTRHSRRPIPSSPLTPSSLPLPAPPSPKGTDSPHSMNTQESLPSMPIVIDIKKLNALHHGSIRSKSSHNDSNLPHKLFRRTRGISPPPRSAPSTPSPLSVPLPHRPQSSSHVKQTPQTPDCLPLSLSTPSIQNQSHARSKSHPTNSVPLGHPNRPYYTAIRPNMSRPSSPVESQSRPPSSSATHPLRPLSLPPLARVPSPGILSMLSTSSVFSTSMFEDHHDSIPRTSSASAPSSAYDHVHQPPFAFAGSLSRHRAGFSLSGETELRIAIARDQDEMSGPGSAEETFKFRDVRTTSRRQTRVMKRVHKLKKGLKDFVLKAL